MINGELIDLRAGGYEARVATQGSTLVHLRHDGRDVVLPFDAETAMPEGWQGRTLVPWPNRIKGSAYTYCGQTYLVACNEPATGSALHGLVGWSDFAVASDTPEDGDLSEVVLELTLPASYAYPWALEVSVRFSQDAASGLTVTTTTTIVGAAASSRVVAGAPVVDGTSAPAPYGVSCHPYLTRSVALDECVLDLPASLVLDVDPHTMAPTATRDVTGTDWDWRGGRLVGATQTDNAYTGLPQGQWSMRLTGGEGGRSAVMTSDVPWCQLYTADVLGRPGVAVEPMTCPPNAFNTGEDLITLAVGESHTFVYRLWEEA